MAKGNVAADNNTRVVTPDNPLVINETNPVFDDVIIRGGEIFAQVATTATFKKLTKES